MNNSKKESINTNGEFEENFEFVDTANEFECITNDFMSKCGYSEEEAKMAAANVIFTEENYAY